MPTMLDQEPELDFEQYARAQRRAQALERHAARRHEAARRSEAARRPWALLGVLGAIVAGFVLLLVLGGPPIEAPLPVPSSTTSTVAGFAGNGNCDQACQAWFAQHRAQTGATTMTDTAPEDIPERELTAGEVAVHDAARALTARGFTVEQDDAGTITARHANGATVVVAGGANG